MIDQLRAVYALLNHRQRRTLAWLLVVIILAGLIDVIGVSSIFPFMAVVARPESIESSRTLHYVYQALGFASPYRFLFALGVGVLLIMLVGNALAAFMTLAILRFSHEVGYELSIRMLTSYLAKSYVFFLSRNSATMVLNIIGETGGMVVGVMIPALQTVAKMIVAACMLSMLLVVDTVLAVIVAVTVGGSYMLVFLFVRKRLSEYGALSTQVNRERLMAATEVLQGIKDFKLLGRTHHYLGSFSRSARDFARYQMQNGLISSLPRYAMESIAFGGILLILLFLLSVRRDVNQALPLIALYALAGYRLLPAIQQIFGGMTQLRFGLSSLGNLHREFDELTSTADEFDEAHQIAEPVRFDRELRLLGVSYRYPLAEQDALRNVDITIRKNTTVGLVGASGAGKTTLIDILLGLLKPSAGAILLDGKPIEMRHLRAWRRCIGYVPQQIYLTESSIARNIAFGLPESEIDMSKVETVARLAHLHDFVEQDLPEKYATVVGERGIRLSGGQRQRIGIARALYHDPQVLVFDEATSALDGITEDAIIAAIGSLAHSKTIILIAHRFSTIRDCDLIYVVEGGAITDAGTYLELAARNEVFRSLGKVEQAGGEVDRLVA